MKKEVSLREIQIMGEENFKKGLFCSESVVKTMIDAFQIEVPEEVIKLASGMASGIGFAGCLCGALNGSLLVLGLLFGRSEQDGPSNPKSIHCKKLCREIHDWFKEANKKNAVCCRILTRGYDMEKGEHKSQCVYFTGLCCWKAGEIICREFGIKNIDAISEPLHKTAPDYK